jgi:16S rRNA (adenine1518-N6/adenine1519-N6)-dimethyltransferase
MFVTPQEYYRHAGIRPRKRFGQNFLVQTKTAESIVDSARLEASDLVVEIGPGLGALTRFILTKVRCLHLVELDRDLADYLKVNIPTSEWPVFVHQQDALTFDFELLSKMEGQRLVVMGNLPYNISSPLIFHLLECRAAIKKAVFMLQKEVGERLTASPGTKDYGVLSVLLGAYGRVTPLFTVGAAQFYPRPKVDSLIVLIEFGKELPAEPPTFEFFRKVVNVAFQQRRKTLQNSLKSLAVQKPALLDEAFSVSRIDPKRRPETLSAEEFMRFGKAMETRVTAVLGESGGPKRGFISSDPRS